MGPDSPLRVGAIVVGGSGRRVLEARAELGLTGDFEPDAERSFSVEIPTDSLAPGSYWVVLDAVYEQQYWFQQRGAGASPLFSPPDGRSTP